MLTDLITQIVVTFPDQKRIIFSLLSENASVLQVSDPFEVNHLQHSS
jgi:hypothetical protein